MANKLFYTYTHTSDGEANNSYIPIEAATAYWNSLVFDVNHRTIWHQGMPFGNVFPGTYSYGEIFNDIDNNQAFGTYAHAEGRNTYANGEHSHTEGYYTYTKASASHVEGLFNNIDEKAIGSHVEGVQSYTYASYSHVEGNSNVCYSNGGHIEGIYNTISVESDYSHAEGNSVTINAKYGHAEGTSTKVNAQGGHAEGNLSNVFAKYGHAEGTQTNVKGENGHTEGNLTTVNGVSGHAEGTSTTADADYSHAEGINTSAKGIGSHSEGYNNISNNTYSHTEGGNNINKGITSHVEGNQNTTNSTYTHSEGNSTYIGSDSTGGHIEGQYNVAYTATSSHIEGQYNAAYNTATHIEGAENIVKKQYGHVEGYKNQSEGIADHVEGTLNASYKDYNHIEGSTNYSKSEYSHVEGYNNSIQDNANFSHVGGANNIISGSSNDSDTITNANCSFAHGYNTRVRNASYAFVSGLETQVNNNGETAIGTYNKSIKNRSGMYGQSNTVGTIFTIGVGTGEDEYTDGATSYRWNAFQVMQNGTTYSYDAYCYNIINGVDHYFNSGFFPTATTAYVMMNAVGKPNLQSRGNGTYPVHAEYFNLYDDVSNKYNAVNNAYGDYSHAEGFKTYIYDDATGGHAEGISTEVRNEGEHASGKYNISSTETGTIFTVGNGDMNTRHNIFSLETNNKTGLAFVNDLPIVCSKPSDTNDIYTGSTYIWKGTGDKYQTLVDKEKLDNDTIYFVKDGDGESRNDILTRADIQEIYDALMTQMNEKLEGYIKKPELRDSRSDSGDTEADNKVDAAIKSHISSASYLWTGTLAEFNALELKDGQATDVVFVIKNN